MKKILFGFIALSGIYTSLSAQQDPQYTMFYFNKMLYNPAYAGAKEAICGTLLGRFQWNGLEGAPNTWVFTGDMPVKLTNNDYLGVGLTGYGDYIGFQQDQGLKVALAYRRKNVGPGHLAIGLDVGFNNKNFTNPAGSWVYPTLNSEPLPNLSTPSAFGFDFGAGVYYHSQKFYAGVSILHLTASSFTAMNMKQARHMFFAGGYTLGLGNSNWKLNPNVIVRTDFANANFDVNLNALYDINGTHGIFFGATYRYIDAIGINVGYNGSFMNGNMGMLFAYNYDINTSRLNSFNSGSHEIILRFCFKTERPKPIVKIYNVRFNDTMQKRY
jgi:type IX secretion system PorP/SprF family membrane protein